MVSDKRGGSQGASGAARGPRPVVTRPGSVNRGFASVDPERQRETGAQGGEAVREDGKAQEPAARAARARGAPAQPTRAKRGRGDQGSGGEGGSA